MERHKELEHSKNSLFGAGLQQDGGRESWWGLPPPAKLLHFILAIEAVNSKVLRF